MSERRDIKHAYLKFSRGLWNFLLSKQSREFFLFLFFIFVAAGFWLIQTLDNDYETDITIPVRLRDVPDDVVITSDPVSSVKVHVRDKGTLLFNYIMGKVFSPLNIDFVAGEGSHVQIPSSSFSKMITSQLSSSTQVVSVTPDTLDYYYSTGQAKLVPVRFQGMATAGPRHYLSDTIFTPDSVHVYAPLALLDTIKAAYMEPQEFRGIDDTLRKEVHLKSARGAKIVPDVSTLTLAVDMYTEKTVEVELHGINFPPDKQLRSFPSKVAITFQCGLRQYNDLTSDDFHIFVSYEDLMKLGNQKYSVRLRNIPKGATNIRFNPAQVDFLIEHIDSSENND
ncbi:MAG: YbbR-like domain-containing protein [Bacteroidaceae bacterium]|nr:YbbR-like domain-containing protein [Bacteroidaceae bacterium]